MLFNSSLTNLKKTTIQRNKADVRNQSNALMDMEIWTGVCFNILKFSAAIQIFTVLLFE